MGTMFEVGAALLGACVGSFLNVVIWRLPQLDPARRSLGGRSCCPRCGTQIAWFDNVPVLAWLWLRGRARCCQQPIAWRYPLVELLTALLFWAVWRWAPAAPALLTNFDGSIAFDGTRAAACGLWAVFLAMLVALSFIDLDTQLLPDVLTIPGMAIGVAAGLWPGLAGAIASDPSTPLALRTLLASVVGLVVGGGATWAIRAVGSAVFRREAMGFGDVKLMGMIGAFLGWRAALLTMFLGCVFGAVIGGIGALLGRPTVIPFGPYLALGALVCLFWQDALLQFLFTTWPEWQRDHPDTQLWFVVFALLAMSVLFFMVRRGRY
jgi:leader peptidase (prepilin peptidase) / N-methyltransferase